VRGNTQNLTVFSTFSGGVTQGLRDEVQRGCTTASVSFYATVQKIIPDFKPLNSDLAFTNSAVRKA